MQIPKYVDSFNSTPYIVCENKRRKKLKNTSISVIILLLSIILSLLICLGSKYFYTWIGLDGHALIPASIFTLVLYPILRKS